ncbi:kelch-like [Apophysomyces ossiformis]|uniref:Kelch-like n=1 Tax=Apophysomyces ossiformis TaxID=679940 RepID=A0A8H7BJR7_9FUNG|nr:kelch-like [Apophysomyces ossiformis]
MTKCIVMSNETPDIIVAIGPDQSTSLSEITIAKRRISLQIHRASQSSSFACHKRVHSSCTGYDSYATTSSGEINKTRWPCHKAVLIAQSPYFSAMLASDFREARASVVLLPRNIFCDSQALDCILNYMYTENIVLHTESNLSVPSQQALERLENVYIAADYLGMEKLCQVVVDRLCALVHHWSCHCQECLCLVPRLFAFCHTRATEYDDERMASMTYTATAVLTHDPDKSIQTFWTSRDLAQVLVEHFSEDMSHQLTKQLLKRVGKSNAIESLYSCFCASRSLATSDPFLSWSHPLHATIASVQSCATGIIARNFDFYCSQYPALLSCIDGITYSFDFLEYLLMHVLEDQMDNNNAGLLYEGIVRDLMCRHAVQHHYQVKHILSVAKGLILEYISRRLEQIREVGGLDQLDRSTLKNLAQGKSTLAFTI